MENVMHSFAIVIDMQRDFVSASGALPVPGAEALSEPAQRWLAGLDPDEIGGVLFTFDTHDPAAYAVSPESTQFPIHCVRGTAGWDSVLDWRAIDPRIPVYRLEKGVFDMWAEPDLMLADQRNAQAAPVPRDDFFRTLAADGVSRVIVIGVAADFCVRWAVDGLIARGFEVEIPRSLTRGIVRDIAAVAAEDLAGARVRLTD
jgi:nicotinamidase/pyrazinamidase